MCYFALFVLSPLKGYTLSKGKGQGVISICSAIREPGMRHFNSMLLSSLIFNAPLDISLEFFIPRGFFAPLDLAF